MEKKLKLTNTENRTENYKNQNWPKNFIWCVFINIFLCCFSFTNTYSLILSGTFDSVEQKTGWAQRTLKCDCMSELDCHSLIVKAPENKNQAPEASFATVFKFSFLILSVIRSLQKSGLSCRVTYHKEGHTGFLLYSNNVNKK